MKRALFFSFVFSMTAQAHIDNGTWKGVNEEGKPCEMLVVENKFENNSPHPLNERIVVEVGKHQFTLRHPPVISVEEKQAFFDHDSFEDIKAIEKGGMAIKVKMSHQEGQEGPTEFHLIHHEYRANVRHVHSCTGLKRE